MEWFQNQLHGKMEKKKGASKNNPFHGSLRILIGNQPITRKKWAHDCQGNHQSDHSFSFSLLMLKVKKLNVLE